MLNFYVLGMIAEIVHNCSLDCDCHFSPKHNLSTIDCSKRNLTKYPEIFPVFENSSSIYLILRDNSIEVQPNLTRLNLISLDISKNRLKSLDVTLFPESLKVSNICIIH